MSFLETVDETLGGETHAALPDRTTSGHPWELALNEVVSIRQVATSVIGDNIVGYAEIEER